MIYDVLIVPFLLQKEMSFHYALLCFEDLCLRHKKVGHVGEKRGPREAELPVCVGYHISQERSEKEELKKEKRRTSEEPN